MEHPYRSHEGTLIWTVIDRTLAELELNSDIVVTTARPYVIGHICEHVARAKVAADTMSEETNR